MSSANRPAGRQSADTGSAKRVAGFLVLAHGCIDREAAALSVAEARGLVRAKAIIDEAARETWPQAFGEGESGGEEVHGEAARDA